MHPSAPQFIIGIDLGTSHTVVASVPIGGQVLDIALLQVPQRISATEVRQEALLPSVRYQAAPGELGDAWQQPWVAQGASEQAPAVIGRTEHTPPRRCMHRWWCSPCPLHLTKAHVR